LARIVQQIRRFSAEFPVTPNRELFWPEQGI
jgi:hypothetical protein